MMWDVEAQSSRGAGTGQEKETPCNCSGLRGAEWLMAEYGGWVTLGDESPKPPAPKPPEKSGSWLKPIYLTKSELLPVS